MPVINEDENNGLILNNNINNENIPERIELQAMTIKVLRELSKENQVNLKGARSKSKIIHLLFSFFLRLKLSKQIQEINILPGDLRIIVDDNGKYNVSQWFVGKGHLFKRCIKSKKFNQLLQLFCQQQEKEEIYFIEEKTDGYYMSPVLAVHAASFLSIDLYKEILEFYVNHRYNQMSDSYDTQIEILSEELLISKEGIIISNKLKWTTFKISFAYYWFVIDDIVKCGVVGRDRLNDDNLDKRFTTHRNTYNNFRLINIIKFNDSATVLAFEG